jgi:hypothetical protein
MWVAHHSSRVREGVRTNACLSTTKKRGDAVVDGFCDRDGPKDASLLTGYGPASSGRSDDGRTVAEAYIKNLARNRRAKLSGEMERRATAYRRLHGIVQGGVLSPTALRLCEDDPRLAYDGAVAREAQANGDLIVIMRRAPAGGDPCRDTMNTGDRRPLVIRLGLRANA